MSNDEFYLRYYVGHTGKFGHEFFEFELDRDGKLKYHNSSDYKGDGLILKEVYVSPLVISEAKRIIEASGIMKTDDSKWPEPDRQGKQELEVVLGGRHISFATTKLGTQVQVQKTQDPEGLTVFYYLVQDLKCFVFSLASLNFKVRPI